MYHGPDAYVLGPLPSRGGDLELESRVNACHVKYVYESRDTCHGEYGPTLNWSPRTNYGCHKLSLPAITGPRRTIRGNKIIVKKNGLQ